MSKASPAVLVPMKRILKFGAIGFLAVPILTAMAYLLADSKIAWSIGLGGLVPLVFFGVTVIAALTTATKSPQLMAGVVGGLSLIKMLALLGLLVVLKDATFYDEKLFAITLLLATSASLTIQALVVLKTRVPTVDLL